MGLFSRYINRGVRSAEKLDKSITGRYSLERNTDMVLNSKKIRRSVVIDGKQKWITADTEQEYAGKPLWHKAFSKSHLTKKFGKKV